jgi:hypothetical protein
LFLGADTIASREVVGQENCNACHDSLRAHGGQRQDVTICLLCHTAGAEDKNDLAAAGGTPGVSVDFKVMIHKIHNGAHLPSVNGIACRSDGSRDYTAVPKPYEVVGYRSSIHDFSEVEFPKWPNLGYEMPADMNYSSLSSTEQDLEDIQRAGVTSCDACHGDPDGAGPIAAPAEGTMAFDNPSRNACGSCHDDVDWALPYNSNAQTMPAGMKDDTCLDCHRTSGDPLANMDAHLHPMLDPALYPGLNFTVLSVDPAGNHDLDATIDVGEKVAISFTMTDDSGADVDPANIGSVAVVVNGPTSNLNLLLNTSIPGEALTGAQPYTMNLPQRHDLEILKAPSVTLSTLQTAYSPLWDDRGADTKIFMRTAKGFATSLVADAPAMMNYIDVADGSGFVRDDYLVIDDGTSNAEYLKVQWVDGDRLWFGSAYQTDYKPGTLQFHGTGAMVEQVSLTELVPDVDFTIDLIGNADISEALMVPASKGDSVVFLASYTSDFVLPATYPLTLNASPDVTEAWGKWTGKSIVPGTYRLGMWSDYDLVLDLHGESNDYPITSPAGMFDFLVEDATTLEPYDLIDTVQNCYACHDDIYFHGGHRRGVDACVQCHGVAGGEDRPQYRAPGAGETTATMIKFREMVHKIHRGADLDKADTYTVNGYGWGGAYPFNFTPHTYEKVVFPTFPGGVKHCEKCHGTSESWQAPRDFAHPTESLMPSRSWKASCGSCHDDDAAQAHIDAQTAPTGAESCAICHDDDSEIDTENVHKPRM